MVCFHNIRIRLQPYEKECLQLHSSMLCTMLQTFQLTNIHHEESRNSLAK